MRAIEQVPLIVHLIDRLDVGGLENGLVNLINHLPPAHYRHAIVCLKNASEFQQRITVQGVEIISLNKREGTDFGHYLRLFKTLRRLKPDLIHTRNLSSIEGQLVAALAGVKLRVHGEHGREMLDLDGQNRRHKFLRRLLRPLVGHFIAVSRDLEHWLIDTIGARPTYVSHIGNGVDSLQFHPRLGPAAAIGPPGFLCNAAFVIGSVGRMVEVKDYATLVRAFLLLHKGNERLRLMIVGDGPCRTQCINLLAAAGAGHLAWLPGQRSDIAQMMRAMDLFVLPSLAEGSSNTILEAMASGLPVLATAVGGNGELVQAGLTGMLVAPGAPDQLAAGILDYYRRPELAARHGARARRHVLSAHSLPAMAGGYLAVYDALTGRTQ